MADWVSSPERMKYEQLMLMGRSLSATKDKSVFILQFGKFVCQKMKHILRITLWIFKSKTKNNCINLW